jgi:hypothetical protein
MRSRLRAVCSALVCCLSLLLGLGAPAHAEAYKTEAACGKSAHSHVTVRYRATAGHWMDISSRMCTNGTFVKWAIQPKVMFPSIKGSPASALESVYVSQKPFIYSTHTKLGGYDRITWRFTMGIKAIKLAEVVNRIFYFRVYPAYAELCQSGYSWPSSHCSRNTWKAG